MRIDDKAVDKIVERSLLYLDSSDLKPRDFKAIADLIIKVYELKLKEGGFNEEDLASLLEKIPSKTAKKFRKLLQEKLKDA